MTAIRDKYANNVGVQAMLSVVSQSAAATGGGGGGDAWDIDLLSYSSDTFTPTEGGTSNYDSPWNDDGTMFYVSNNNSDTIYQYSAASHYVVAGATYTTKSFYVGDQEGQPWDLKFSPDGATLLVIGNENTIRQYNLTTPWDISTAEYNNKSFTLGVEIAVNSSRGIDLNDDGTIMIVVDNSGTLEQYTLGTGWDIETASYASKSFDVSSQEPNPTTIRINNDGTTVFMGGLNYFTVWQYTLVTPWDISTAGYNDKNLDITAQGGVAYGITMKPDGSEMLVTAHTGKIFRYSTS